MSIAAQNRVWEHSRLDGTNLIAMLALADWADVDGICWYSNEKIAERVRREERTVTRILNKLRKSGEIFAPPEYGAGRKTLKFVTVGLPEGQLVDVLTRRFGMTPIEATATALKILKAQAKSGKKPDTDDGLNGDKSADKPDTDDTFNEEKPVTDDGNKPDISAQKGDIYDQKPDIAMSPDPNDPFDPSTDPTDQLPLLGHSQSQNGGGGSGKAKVKKILQEGGIEEPKLSALLELAYVTPDYAKAHLAHAPNVAVAIYRMEHAWKKPRVKKGRDLMNQIPPEYLGIIKR